MSHIGGTLGRRLALPEDSTADRFDPARFHYIASMVRRCVGKRASVVRRIEKKVLSALEDYELDYKKARKEAVEIVNRLFSDDSDAADKIHELFEMGDFKGVRRMSKRLHGGCNQRALAALTKQLSQSGALYNENEAQLSLGERLRHQEEKVVQSYGQSRTGEDLVSSADQMMPRSFHLFKEAWTKQYANTLVTHAIKDRPEDPGPLNGQMLAIRSLSAMRKLSPSYLNRFITYVDTLLWLQQADKEVTMRTTKRK